MQVRGALAAALFLTFVRGTGMLCQTAPLSADPGNSPARFRIMMDQPRPMAEVLSGSFSAAGQIQIVTRTLLLKMADTVQPFPLLGDPVGAYITPGANGGMAVQMSAFGEPSNSRFRPTPVGITVFP
jgi:hypothetical protein